jgi:hypothetical protein
LPGLLEWDVWAHGDRTSLTCGWGCWRWCGGVSCGQHRLALGTGSPCGSYTSAGIAAVPRDAMAAGKATGLPGGRSSSVESLIVMVSGGEPGPSSPACSPGGKPAGQRQRGGQHGQRCDRPPGLAVRLGWGSRWAHSRMPGLPDLALSGRPPHITSEGLLTGRGPVLVPGLPDLALGGWPLVVVGECGFALGVGDAGMPARLAVASRAPSTTAWASLEMDMGASGRSMGELRVGWLAGPRGPAGEQLPPAARR